MTRKRFETVDVWVAGHPVPQLRMTRASKWQLKNHPIWTWRDAVAWSVACKHVPGWPLVRTTEVYMGFSFKVMVEGREREGDLDNYIKGVKDCLTGVVYDNDRQVRKYLEPTGIEKVGLRQLEGVALLICW